MIKLGKYEICILDLLTDSRSGKLSASKLWLHIANGTSTYLIVNQPEATWEMLAVYNAIVGGSYVAIQFFKWRYNQSPPYSGGNHYMDDNEHPDGMDGGLEPRKGAKKAGFSMRGRKNRNEGGQ